MRSPLGFKRHCDEGLNKIFNCCRTGCFGSLDMHTVKCLISACMQKHNGLVQREVAFFVQRNAEVLVVAWAGDGPRI